MKLLKQTLAAAVLVFGASTTAHATWMSGVYITTADPYSFTLNVAQQQNTKIESAKLSLLLSDPIDYWFTTHEVLPPPPDNKLAGTISNVDYFGGKYSFNVLPSLLSDGKLNVSLSLGCDPTCYGSCIGQDVLLRDVLLAITRVPTTPTVPPVSKPNPTPVTPPPATAPVVVVTPPATPPVTPPATTPDTTPPATAPVVVVAPPATTPTPTTTPDAPTSTAPVVVVTPPAFDPAGPELPVDLPDNGDANPAAPAEVPEPATLLTLGLGLLGLASVRRRT